MTTADTAAVATKKSIVGTETETSTVTDIATTIAVVNTSLLTPVTGVASETKRTEASERGDVERKTRRTARGTKRTDADTNREAIIDAIMKKSSPVIRLEATRSATPATNHPPTSRQPTSSLPLSRSNLHRSLQRVKLPCLPVLVPHSGGTTG